MKVNIFKAQITVETQPVKPTQACVKAQTLKLLKDYQNNIVIV